MKTLTTLSILLVFTSCITIPERHVIKEIHTNQPVKSLPKVKKDSIDRYLDCLEKFNNLGKRHEDAMEACNTAFNK